MYSKNFLYKEIKKFLYFKHFFAKMYRWPLKLRHHAGKQIKKKKIACKEYGMKTKRLNLQEICEFAGVQKLV